MAQNASSSAEEGVRLLALGASRRFSLRLGIGLTLLDGGGIRGLSELLILNEMMRRVQIDLNLAELPRPCDYFHLIGGTSTGG